MKSLDGQYIYACFYNPLLQRVRMQSCNSCGGCTAFSLEYDKDAYEYLPYCSAFGVWNEFKESGGGFVTYPNEVCKHNVREMEN
jgi:hypothetical protein